MMEDNSAVFNSFPKPWFTVPPRSRLHDGFSACLCLQYSHFAFR